MNLTNKDGDWCINEHGLTQPAGRYDSMTIAAGPGPGGDRRLRGHTMCLWGNGSFGGSV